MQCQRCNLIHYGDPKDHICHDLMAKCALAEAIEAAFTNLPEDYDIILDIFRNGTSVTLRDGKGNILLDEMDETSKSIYTGTIPLAIYQALDDLREL